MKRILILAALLAGVLPLCAQTESSADWAHKNRYSKANSEVSVRPKAVLMGDSITQGWFEKDPGFFPENNFLGRGISGECTAQMLLRFRSGEEASP